MTTCKDLPIHWFQQPPSIYQLKRYFDVLDASAAIRRLRLWEKSGLAEDIRISKERVFKASICGFSTLNYLEDYFNWAVLSEGLIPQVALGGYNQLFQELTNSESPVLYEDVELCCIFVELSDLLPVEYASDAILLQSPKGLDIVNQGVDTFLMLLESARRRTKAFLLVNDFYSVRPSPYGIADCKQSVCFERIYSAANERLCSGLKQITHSGILPVGYLIKKHGLSCVCDARIKLLADCRFTESFIYEIAGKIRPYIRAIRGTFRKVLALDLDNTLWGGVVGEDGWDGIKLGTDPVGKAYADFQSAVLELHKRGVILAVNSKNNKEDVQEVFDRRDEMILKPKHFASLQINWNDKATNCVKIAEEINVGLDSLVFWDDNPAERSFVHESLEHVEVVKAPQDISLWADYVRNMDCFDVLHISDEDVRRGQMYAENRLRVEAETKATDLDSFLACLELRVERQYVCQENISRIVSLLSRTNQFNLTTKRHSEEDIRRWAGEPDWKIMSFSAQDKFGSYGIVGVVILRISGKVAEIDSLLLSCRAMGKGIEQAMVWQAAQQTQNGGATVLKAAYIPTKKNAPAKSFLPGCGFVKTGEDDGRTCYEYDLSKNQIKKPDHVAFVEKG